MADDLRSWLSKVEALEDVRRVEGANWDLEIGCLTALNWKEMGPALLFDKIKGYPAGLRVLTNSILAPNRTKIMLGLPLDYSDKQVWKALREKLPQWETNLDKFSPVAVKSGPVMENVLTGQNINLLSFPVPKWNEKDGGRYIGTGDAVITRDMDTGELNIGTYRVMVQDERTAGLHISPGKHGRLHLEKYHSRGLPCPILVSIGHHPLFFAIASNSWPAGTEYQYIGAIRGEPVEVIEEEVTGLPMPADSELVIAGWCPPGKTRPEGPFGEYTGYYASGERPGLIIEVERIYHRNNPIILGSPPGRSPSDTTYFHSPLGSMLIERELKKFGIPDVMGVWTHAICAQYFVTVSIKQRFAGHAKQAALIASEAATKGGLGGRYVIVVDEDIDVTDLRHVLWALCTRSDPEKDINIISRVRSTPLDPIIRRPVS
ncbi:UbiD family decarboxylase, partial [Chloroflexota bacterium]